MIEFLASHWWVWIPIIAILLYLTHQNNKKLEAKQKGRSTKDIGILNKLAGKLGLRGFFNYIFPKK